MGEELVWRQMGEILAALLAGCAGGLAFWLYQRLCYGGSRRKLPSRTYLLKDAVFVMWLLLLLISFWFGVTDGSLRASLFLWMAAGFIFYTLTLRPMVRALLSRLPRRKKKERNRSKKVLGSARQKTAALADKQAAAYLKASRIVRAAGIDLRQKIKERLPGKKEGDDDEF